MYGINYQLIVYMLVVLICSRTKLISMVWYGMVFIYSTSLYIIYIAHSTTRC